MIRPVFEKCYSELISNQFPVFLTEDGSIQATLQTLMDPYVHYCRKYWLDKVTPKRISIYQVPYTTNGGIERYHRGLNTMMGVHPRTLIFIGK